MPNNTPSIILPETLNALPAGYRRGAFLCGLGWSGHYIVRVSDEAHIVVKTSPAIIMAPPERDNDENEDVGELTSDELTTILSAADWTA